MDATLNGNVPLVVIQLSFSNKELVPWCVKEMNKEGDREAHQRAIKQNGQLIVQPVEECSVSGLIDDLEYSHYQLVDASWQERVNNRKEFADAFYVVKFVFARDNSSKLGYLSQDIRSALRSLLIESAWRVRAFANPFMREGQAVSGLSAWSINLELRKQLFDDMGNQLMVWPKDERGRSMKGWEGVEKVPLLPKNRVWLIDGQIIIKPFMEEMELMKGSL